MIILNLWKRASSLVSQPLLHHRTEIRVLNFKNWIFYDILKVELDKMEAFEDLVATFQKHKMYSLIYGTILQHLQCHKILICLRGGMDKTI